MLILLSISETLKNLAPELSLDLTRLLIDKRVIPS